MRERTRAAAALEGLYRDRYASFVRVATVMCRDAEAGRDAVQAAFVTALAKRSSLRRQESLEAWVWQIVVNEARRARRQRGTVSDTDAVEEITFHLNGDDGDPLGVRRWIATLPQRQREAVFLRYFADLDYRTIARLLDLEPGTVSATLNAAHTTLRARLEATTK